MITDDADVVSGSTVMKKTKPKTLFAFDRVATIRDGKIRFGFD